MKNRKVLLIALVIIAVILIVTAGGVLYILRPQRTYELNLPLTENIKSISVEREEKGGVIANNYMIEALMEKLNENKKTTKKESISDSPVNATDKLKFDFNFEQGASTISVYQKKGKYYLEQPYNGIYEISEEEYKLMDKIARATINGSASVIDAVVVKVNENHLSLMEKDDKKSLLTASFAKEGNIGFKQGQEVSVYSDGFIEETYPAGISGVNKIEITKEKSDIEISETAIKWFCNSIDKISVTVDELTKSGISFTIIDNNEVPYDYNIDFKIRKKVNNENGYTWENVDRISNKSIKLETYTEEAKNSKVTIIKNRCNWNEVYGELKERRI